MESEHFLNAQPLLQYFDQSSPMAACPDAFPRWDKSPNRALQIDSLLSSPAASNVSHENLAIRELIGKLGTINEIPGQPFYSAQQKVSPDVHRMKRHHFQPGLPGFGSLTGEFNPFEPVGNSPEEESTVSGQAAVSRKRKASSKGKAKETDTTNKSDSSKCKPKDDKSAEPPKDYIHVRARRGQATDSHSLAERVRREKISERMKLLQDLVPGCNKVTGKASMLDEIINYVQSLQRQVEFLSMKLASLDTMEALLSKEVTATASFFQTNQQVPDPVFSLDAILGLPSTELDDTFHLLNFDNSFCEGDLQTVVHMGFNAGYASTRDAGMSASACPLSNMKIEL